MRRFSRKTAIRRAVQFQGSSPSGLPWGFSLLAIALVLSAVLTLAGAVEAQSGASQGSNGQGQAPPAPSKQTQSQGSQDIPDAPSAAQPPAAAPALPKMDDRPSSELPPPPSDADANGITPAQPRPANSGGLNDETPPPAMPPVETVPPGSRPNSATPNSAAKDQLFKLTIQSNFVQIPVMVKDNDGRRVDGLLPKDFTVLENGKKQTLAFFSSDPFELSAAIVLDLGMPDTAVQKVNQTFPALVGAFSPYDEVALYTYSSTVSQVSGFSSAGPRLVALLNQMKSERGHNTGVPVLNGPLASGPTVNGIPVGTSTPPVNTPPKEAHVLNDAILRAALDLSKRDRTRRKVIFLISDGREMESEASYRDVLKLLLAQGIQVKAIALETAALPVYNKLERLHLPHEGYGNLLPKYASATGGGQVFTEVSRNSIEEAYAEVTSEARNQYTLGYTTRSTASSTYRNVEVRVDRSGLKIYAKDGYYPIGSTR